MGICHTKLLWEALLLVAKQTALIGVALSTLTKVSQVRAIQITDQ